MSTPDPKPADAAAAAAAPKKKSAVGGVLGLLVPALIAAGAAYGGARVAAAHGPPPAVVYIERPAEVKPPGPTVALEPFLVTIQDAQHKGHAMKMSVAIEFAHSEKGGGGEHEGDGMKPFAPRIRDAVLGYVRGMTYEEASNGHATEKMRADLLERCQKAGAAEAERVLITDFVIQ